MTRTAQAPVDMQATVHLDALSRRAPQPWELSFSLGRAVLAWVLHAWDCDDTHDAAQAGFTDRALPIGAARRGDYRTQTEELVPPQA